MSEAAEEAPYTGPWRCYHCDYVARDRHEAEEHFGYDYGEKPLCLQIVDEGTLAIAASRRQWKEDYFKLQEELEQTQYELSGYTWGLYQKFGKARTMSQAAFEYESMEGRVIAAEAALGILPRWLQNLLRQEHERRWKKRNVR